MALLERIRRHARDRWHRYVANRHRYRIERYLLADAEIVAVHPFIRPIGINMDQAGRILVAELDGHRVVRLTAEFEFDGWLGAAQRDATAGGAGWRYDVGSARRGSEIGAFARPHGIDFDDDGAIYVTELDNCRVQIFTPDGVPTGSIPAPGHSPPLDLNGPATARLGSDGLVYVTDFRGNSIHRYDRHGQFHGWLGDGGGDLERVGFGSTGSPRQSARHHGFFKPHVARMDAGGFLIVADTWNHRLIRFDPAGRFAGWLGAEAAGRPADGWRMTGAASASPVPGGFDAPVAVDFDAADNLIVAEYGNHRIQRFSAAGEFLGWLGGGTDGTWARAGESRTGNMAGYFRHPYDVVVHRKAIYVADTENGRIQIIRPLDPKDSI